MFTLLRLVERDDVEALRELAERLRVGDGVRKNRKKAFILFLKGAALGDPYLTWCVGDAYEHGEGVIPFLVRQCTNYPRPSGDSLSPFRGLLEVGESQFEVIFQGYEAVKDAVMERLLTKVVPKVFDRV